MVNVRDKLPGMLMPNNSLITIKILLVSKVGLSVELEKTMLHSPNVDQTNYLEVTISSVKELKLRESSLYHNTKELELSSSCTRSIHGIMRNSNYLLMARRFGVKFSDSIHQGSPNCAVPQFPHG